MYFAYFFEWFLFFLANFGRKKHIITPVLWKHAHLSHCSEIVAAVIAIWTVAPPGDVDGAQVYWVQHDGNYGEDGTNYVHEHSNSNLKRKWGGGDMAGDGAGFLFPLTINKGLTSADWLDFTDQTWKGETGGQNWQDSSCKKLREDSRI